MEKLADILPASCLTSVEERPDGDKSSDGAPLRRYPALRLTAVLYSTFRLVLVDQAGRLQETTGRGTEVSLRRHGRWVHTGWHLDTVGS